MPLALILYLTIVENFQEIAKGVELLQDGMISMQNEVLSLQNKMESMQSMLDSLKNTVGKNYAENQRNDLLNNIREGAENVKDIVGASHLIAGVITEHEKHSNKIYSLNESIKSEIKQSSDKVE